MSKKRPKKWHKKMTQILNKKNTKKTWTKRHDDTGTTPRGRIWTPGAEQLAHSGPARLPMQDIAAPQGDAHAHLISDDSDTSSSTGAPATGTQHSRKRYAGAMTTPRLPHPKLSSRADEDRLPMGRSRRSYQGGSKNWRAPWGAKFW